MAYDSSNRETVRVEGLKSADTCPADVASYTATIVGPAKPQRKISTQWHPQWNLQTQVVEPNLITTTVYNDQTDLVDPAHPKLNCAPSAPALPDGSKIAVVCKRYEQATTDTLGNLSAANATVTDTRSWSYSYNQYGQVLTETDPRGKATNYEYWTEPTSFTGEGAAARGHTLGDLKTVTQGPSTANPLKTQYTEYNKLGQVLTTVLPNGSTESREYHVRGWLSKLTQTPAGGGTGLVTSYDYYATGLLKQVTQPDGSWTLNTYDDAHRLTDVSSSDGNSEHYELDNAGNRLTESYFKGTDVATRTLVRTVTRTYDALGRMQSVSGLQ
ncbi:RHS repeat domain-containing protein [Ideonella azotifigens]|uniref:RHS repeat protein n=1 Tax=Ideonella azotifigens TaxID=513160 RepID=A0ABN1K225_9BURK|nr:RHS repeat domain-containing protein [Ideonella azotifigens]